MSFLSFFAFYLADSSVMESDKCKEFQLPSVRYGHGDFFFFSCSGIKVRNRQMPVYAVCANVEEMLVACDLSFAHLAVIYTSVPKSCSSG